MCDTHWLPSKEWILKRGEETNFRVGLTVQASRWRDQDKQQQWSVLVPSIEGECNVASVLFLPKPRKTSQHFTGAFFKIPYRCSASRPLQEEKCHRQKSPRRRADQTSYGVWGRLQEGAKVKGQQTWTLTDNYMPDVDAGGNQIWSAGVLCIPSPLQLIF